MKYFTFKLATARLCAVCLGVCLLFGALCLTGSFSALGRDVFSSATARNERDFSKADARISFLEEKGWEVVENPVMVRDITLPQVFDEVYERYNKEIQIANGFDLSRYKGRAATLYSYRVINYPTEDEVHANLIVCDGVLIGGDICSVALDGFMHGFTLPDGVLTPSSSELDD